MDIITLVIQLIAGALGGNIVGQFAKNLSLGFVGNTLAGLVGGGAGGYLLQALGVNVPPIDPSAIDVTALAGQVGAGAGGGGILMVIISMLKNMFAK